jgi:3-hydroxy-3-methylglutaryl CoA synthase
MYGVTAFGAYIPRLRLQRSAIASAHVWMNPNAKAGAKGERSMANWDEDCVTMAVEAARDCLGTRDRQAISALYLASTTLPFQDRQCSGLVAAALNLPETLAAFDLASTQRAGTSALAQGLAAVKAGAADQILVTAADTRATKAASTQEMQFGDGAAALLLGRDHVIAAHIGGSAITVDFVDHFRGAGEEFDYGWEERWIRDEGISKIVPRAINAALKSCNLAPSDIAHFIMPCVFPGLTASLAKSLGIAPEAVRDNLSATLGETGAAHPLLMLAHCLESAKPGERILVAGFGQGCDALIFQVTDAILTHQRGQSVSGHLKAGRVETNYIKYLVFRGLIDWEKGMRAEKDNKTALTTLYRKRDMILGLVGGICQKCGTAQFPRARICVNPNCNAVDSQDPYPFADQPAKILSWSADFLTFSMDPPQHYGMVTFDGGGRFLADFTDCEAGQVESGMSVRMVFRIKDFDEKRGFRRYFWKAVPIQPPSAQA